MTIYSYIQEQSEKKHGKRLKTEPVGDTHGVSEGVSIVYRLKLLKAVCEEQIADKGEAQRHFQNKGLAKTMRKITDLPIHPTVHQDSALFVAISFLHTVLPPSFRVTNYSKVSPPLLQGTKVKSVYECSEKLRKINQNPPQLALNVPLTPCSYLALCYLVLRASPSRVHFFRCGE